MSLSRTLEPEVMDTTEEAVDYDSMDHADVNTAFVDDLMSVLKNAPQGQTIKNASIVDLGTGTALIPLEIFRRQPDVGRILACDLSQEMLKIAEQHIQKEKADCIQALYCDCKQLPLPDGSQDVVISNSIVHHIPNPEQIIAEAVRVLKPSGVMLIRDLMRPETDAEVERLVALYTGDENAHQQQMFRQSLHAALTVDEVELMLSRHNLQAATVTATSDRHWTIVCYGKHES